MRLDVVPANARFDGSKVDNELVAELSALVV